MDRTDLALVIASDLAGAGAEAHPLDRVRMQKAVFLATQRGSAEWRSLYMYKPYDWGPYSQELANDVDMLRYTRLLKTESVTGSRYGRFCTTSAGEARASEVWATLEEREKRFLQKLRKYVTSKSFNHLLREVYAAYPEYATESRFRG